jgi:RNA polymerase sigma-70 factor (ECF subfamily)
LLPRLWRFCLVMSGDRNVAEDLAQAACLRALEYEHQFLVGTRLDRWVFRIARTIWLNQLRAERVRTGNGVVALDDAGLFDTTTNADEILNFNDLVSQVLSLPVAQRTAVLLVYVEGYSYREAADHLEIPIGTVMSRLAAARLRLSDLRGDKIDDNVEERRPNESFNQR